ncbi:MAG: asparagine synthase (glutamine-hydrolyzing) [Campylobacter hyointestinalis]
MCGISGVINKNNNQINIDEIKKINDTIAHRGPDDEGFYLGKNFAFGHRRLSILDLSAEGHQSMSYLERYIITYNGEVYNYLEIKNELLKDGYIFHSHTDTEVILASYDRWGEKCVEKFNGMWAFAIYDKEKNIIFCSRDRFGVKPFYYIQVKDRFVFGSEIKQLLPYTEAMANKEILIDYIIAGFVDHTNKTFFDGICKLQGSHNLIYDLNSHKFEIKRYYEIEIDDVIANQSLENSINLYEKELNRSIDIRLRSDVLVGTCLSGGLDSSSIASLAAKKYNKNGGIKFNAIHAKSIEKSTDESEFAKIVANSANLNLNIVESQTKDFMDYINEVIYAQEEPFGEPSIFMQYFVMQKAKEIGCKVMLDGQGGDETLLGYERYYPAIYIDIFKKDGFLAALKGMKDSNKNNSKMNIKKVAIYVFGTLISSLRKLEYKRRTSFMKKYKNNFGFLNIISKSYLNIFNLQKQEIERFNLPALLRYEDKNSMKHSIEIRLPFLDYQTLNIAINISSRYKIKDGWSKFILRQIIGKILPQEVVWRKNKFGFNAPDNIWLRSIENSMKENI